MATVATGTLKWLYFKLKNPESIVTYLFLQLLTSLTKSSLVFYSQ
jgi:hypothetical protein